MLVVHYFYKLQNMPSLDFGRKTGSMKHEPAHRAASDFSWILATLWWYGKCELLYQTSKTDQSKGGTWEEEGKEKSNQSFQTDSVQHHTAPRGVVPASQTSIFVSISRESSNLHLELLTREKLEGGSSLENSARRQLTEVISTSNFVLNLRASVC